MEQFKDIYLTVLLYSAATYSDKYYLNILHNAHQKPILIRTEKVHRHKADE